VLCRNCGTEIADKAIVCYRCGTSTSDPVRAPASLERGRNPLLSFAVAALLVLLALYLGQASRTAANPERWQTIAGLLTALALGIVVLRVLRRR
jgi:hypothetical protein